MRIVLFHSLTALHSAVFRLPTNTDPIWFDQYWLELDPIHNSVPIQSTAVFKLRIMMTGAVLSTERVKTEEIRYDIFTPTIIYHWFCVYVGQIVNITEGQKKYIKKSDKRWFAMWTCNTVGINSVLLTNIGLVGIKLLSQKFLSLLFYLQLQSTSIPSKIKY